ncbi:MAG: MmcQ/YjbR family DNA-binding protein [Fimbriimonadaceae bacterium]
MASEDDVRRICLALPETSETPYERLPGFRVKKKLFARIRQKPDALVVWRPHVDEKRALIAADPDKFFQTPHYEGHPAVLVRLDRIELGELAELLTLSWLLNAPARLAKAFESSEECPDGPSSPS